MTQPAEPQPAASERPSRWGLGDAFVGFVAGLTLSILIGSIWLSAHPGQDEPSIGGQGLAQLGLWTGLVGAVVFASHRKGSGRLATDFGFRLRPKDLLVGLVAGVVCHELLIGLIRLLLHPLLGDPDTSGPTQDLMKSASGVALAVFVVFVTVGAPLVEELFFRGLVLRSLERRLSSSLAIIGSAVLFGLAHVQPLETKGLILVLVSLTAFGAVLAWLAVASGRLGAALVAHAVFNAWTVFFLLR